MNLLDEKVVAQQYWKNLLGEGVGKILQVTTHQEELFWVFKYSFLSDVFIMKTWKSHDYLSPYWTGRPKPTIVSLGTALSTLAVPSQNGWWQQTNHGLAAPKLPATSPGDCRPPAEQSDTGPCYATPEHDSGLPSECISHRIRKGSSSTPPCTITCCFLVINWIKA